MTPSPPTRRHDFDVAIVGGGFAGSILAQILRQLGRSVVLIERHRHPRWVIGESSTPVANLLLEQLGDRYQLPALRSLARWGTWQRDFPNLPCGLKRGFSFYHHSPGQPWIPSPGHQHELLVAASPRDAIADTHWFRPDFDAFLFAEAARLGAEVHEDTQLDPPQFSPTGVQLSGSTSTGPFNVSARFLIDASGPRGFLHRSLGLADAIPDWFPKTEAVYGHFTDVPRWTDLHPPDSTPPFPPDDAALHHVTDNGWMWVLRFNNGITSAGFARLRPAGVAHPSNPDLLWRDWLARMPSVQECFRHARPVRPLSHLPQLPFRTSRAAGPRWAMLPLAAGFVDPLLSTGFALSLLGIERLAHAFTASVEPDLTNYESDTLADLDHTLEMVAALYRVMPRFDRFQQLLRLYFIAVIFTETLRRLGRPSPGFLLRDHPRFSPVARACLAAIRSPNPDIDWPQVEHRIQQLTEEFDLAGFDQPPVPHWHGCDAVQLHRHAHKIPATRDQIDDLLHRTGFISGQPI